MHQLYSSFKNAIYSGIAKKSLFFFLSVFFVSVLFAQPTITSFSPISAIPGTSITITGTSFNSTAGNNIVFFGATRATVTAATATQLTVTVPTSATYAPITELNTATNLACYSLLNFNPIYSPAKTGIASSDFAAKVDFTTGNSPCAVAIGDLDGDGKPDLVVSNFNDNTVSVYRNIASSGISSGSFASPVTYTGFNNPYSVAIGDLDGDGKPDLVVTNYGSTVSVLLNTSTSGSITSSSFAAKVDFATSTRPTRVAIGDLDGDGKPDLVTTNVLGGNISILRNTSTIGSITSSSFAAKVDFSTGGGYPNDIAIGDLDGDGKPDLAVATNGRNSVSVFRNTSTSGSITSSSFAAKVDFATAGNAFSVAIGDLDGDSKPDLAIASQAGTISVLRNTATSGSITTGSFATHADFVTGANPQFIAIGDLDGDGKPDLVVENLDDGTVSVFRNTSTSGSITTSSFAAKVDFVSGSNPQSIAIDDLDGDGKPDLVMANTPTNSFSILRNIFTNISSFSPSSGSVGTLVTITGINLSSPTALTIGGVSAIAISNTGTSLVAMVMPGATTGTVVVTTAGGTATSASNFTVIASQTPNGQQGGKLVGTGGSSNAQQGRSVAVSADGNTAIVGGLNDNNAQGAVWVYTRSGSTWTQQGSKLVGTGSVGYAGNYVYQGYSVALSADGNTAILGGFYDNSIGAVWIFTRSGGTWTQQGSKLTANDNTGAAHLGSSVSLSADGNTAMVGGRDDNVGIGAAWVYTRSGSVWTQQGSKLVGTGSTGTSNQGSGVFLSADGNSAIVGGYGDNGGIGAAWIYTRSGSVWTQQGSLLVGTGATGTSNQGSGVSLSADGNTALVGGNGDNSNVGAAWIWTRSGSTWTQQGSKLAASDATAGAQQGFRVSLSADGNSAIVGGYGDNSNVGAAWIWTRSGSTWTQQGSKLVGTGNSGSAAQGGSLSLSADGNTAIIGGYGDNSNQGAAWVYTYVPAPTISSFTASSGAVGTLVTITGTNLSSPTALTIGGVSAIAVSNTGTSLVAMVMPGATTGTVVVTTAGGTATSASNFTVIASQTPNGQQGSKLVGTGNTGTTRQGYSVSVSADGNTAIVGGISDNSNQGAVWVYTRSGSTWTQQGNKLTANDNIGTTRQGYSVSLSADGNTVLVGGVNDNSNIGAAWVYTRSGGVWTQQGSKLVGTGAVGASQQGSGVSLSADGNTALVGGYNDNSFQGAIWVYTRSGSTWTQQGTKLTANDNIGAAEQGNSVSLSADGNTAMVGGYGDNNNNGAVWIYIRSAGVWTQQGSKLVGTGNTGRAQEGSSVSLSADGNTAMVGGIGDNNSQGGAWVWTRSGSTWTQQGSNLVGTGNTGAAWQGNSVSLSADGNTAIVAGYQDNGGAGAVWVYTRSGSTWTQQGSKLVGIGGSSNSFQGSSVSLSADGNTAIVGGYNDNSSAGAAWVDTYVQTPTISSFTASSGAVGTLVTITGTNLTNPTALTIGSVSAIVISNTGTSLVAMVMPGATTGTVVVTTAGGTATSSSNFTVTASQPPNAQQGSKFVGTGATGTAGQGRSVAVSADGNTAIVGGLYDNSSLGAVWIYTRSAGVWTQQGSKLVGSGSTGSPIYQGLGVSLSADGNTAMVGGEYDNSSVGAVWVYTRTGGVWTQQGTKLVGTGATGTTSSQGVSVSLSADGNSAIVGGWGDNSSTGAAWIWTRSGGVWTQQGSKLVASDATGSAQQGISVALSADGKTAIVGGYGDNGNVGASWVYTLSGGTWTQQGSKLIGTGASGNAQQGYGVSLSADGNTALVGGFADNANIGAAWVWTRSGSVWTQQGSKLTASDATGTANQGIAVAISADGNTAIVGGSADNAITGASWIYTRSGSVWTQQGNKLVGTATTGSRQGYSVFISADGNTAIAGGWGDNSNTGAAWVYIPSNTWTGTTNTDWATATNWSYGTVPVSTDGVIIPSVSNQPIIGISTTAALNNLTINSSATLTVNNILQIGGTISNSGTLTATSGTITMNGSSAQTIPASAFSINTIKNLTINNSAGVTLAGTLNITGTVTPTSGILTTGGFLTLVSTLTGSGIIAQGSGTYLSGNITVQRYVGNNIQWRMVGFPFTAATTISETTLAAFYSSGYKAYTYNEAGDNGAYGGSGGVNTGWSQFTTGTIYSDKGLLLSGGTISSAINFSGPVNTGTQNIALSYTVADVNRRGWNLIANPYASNINWTSIQSNNTSNLDNAIYRYDPGTTAFATYVNAVSVGHLNNIIENGAGFMVHSTGATTLSISETDKTNTAPLASLLGVQPIGVQEKSIIKLSLLKQGENYGDEVVVRWGVDPATDGFDGKYDAYDMGRATGADLSVVGKDGTVYSIFHGSPLQTKDKEQREVALGIKNIAEGNYSINTNLLSAMYAGNDVFLRDHYTNQTTLISTDSASYAFMVTSDANSSSTNRFSIALNYKAVDHNTANINLPVLLLNNPSTGNLFTLYSKNTYNQLQWEIVDDAGRLLQTGLLSNVLKGSTHQINAGNTKHGSYFIKLNGDGNALPVLKAIKN